MDRLPELYNSLGAGGPIAESFIANLTDLYSGSPVPMTEGTRTMGRRRHREVHSQLVGRDDRVVAEKVVVAEAILSGFSAHGDDRRFVQRLLVRGVAPAEL